MIRGEADLLALLRELDDPGHLERPRGDDHYAPAQQFDKLAARIEADFGTDCAAEQDTQDSSEYGRVHIPATATACGTRIVICISRFGSLALICADNPGAFLGTQEAQDMGELDPADLARTHRALTDLGYTVVPEELLESHYDGPSRLPGHVQRPTWWHRFFGTF
ncbi:hypothetical protein [Actinomadura harenae]|uniref:Uncharacterized protein n=1 Tax=Actinomadura harenae TaxID=2483351 RepID=A0A3M2M3B9_9ACTN|nr:hypothetical protein [Actinomadura harenae]RMI43303.1 hypothetical protein EBO15_16610 [Actinomadura harenae]